MTQPGRVNIIAPPAVPQPSMAGGGARVPPRESGLVLLQRALEQISERQQRKEEQVRAADLDLRNAQAMLKAQEEAATPAARQRVGVEQAYAKGLIPTDPGGGPEAYQKALSEATKFWVDREIDVSRMVQAGRADLQDEWRTAMQARNFKMLAIAKIQAASVNSMFNQMVNKGRLTGSKVYGLYKERMDKSVREMDTLRRRTDAHAGAGMEGAHLLAREHGSNPESFNKVFRVGPEEADRYRTAMYEHRPETRGTVSSKMREALVGELDTLLTETWMTESDEDILSSLRERLKGKERLTEAQVTQALRKVESNKLWAPEKALEKAGPEPWRAYSGITRREQLPYTVLSSFMGKEAPLADVAEEFGVDFPPIKLFDHSRPLNPEQVTAIMSRMEPALDAGLGKLSVVAKELAYNELTGKIRMDGREVPGTPGNIRTLFQKHGMERMNGTGVLTIQAYLQGMSKSLGYMEGAPGVAPPRPGDALTTEEQALAETGLISDPLANELFSRTLSGMIQSTQHVVDPATIEYLTWKRAYGVYEESIAEAGSTNMEIANKLSEKKHVLGLMTLAELMKQGNPDIVDDPQWERAFGWVQEANPQAASEIEKMVATGISTSVVEEGTELFNRVADQMIAEDPRLAGLVRKITIDTPRESRNFVRMWNQFENEGGTNYQRFLEDYQASEVGLRLRQQETPIAGMPGTEGLPPSEAELAETYQEEIPEARQEALDIQRELAARGESQADIPVPEVGTKSTLQESQSQFDQFYQDLQYEGPGDVEGDTMGVLVPFEPAPPIKKSVELGHSSLRTPWKSFFSDTLPDEFPAKTASRFQRENLPGMRDTMSTPPGVEQSIRMASQGLTPDGMPPEGLEESGKSGKSGSDSRRVTGGTRPSMPPVPGLPGLPGGGQVRPQATSAFRGTT